jgi:hypothetical protein
MVLVMPNDRTLPAPVRSFERCHGRQWLINGDCATPTPGAILPSRHALTPVKAERVLHWYLLDSNWRAGEDSNPRPPDS